MHALDNWCWGGNAMAICSGNQLIFLRLDLSQVHALCSWVSGLQRHGICVGSTSALSTARSVTNACARQLGFCKTIYPSLEMGELASVLVVDACSVLHFC